MIATLSWAPLKNSGFRSIGMSFVALLVVIDPHPIGVKRSVFFGDPASSVTPRSNRLPAATELPRHRPVNIAGSVQTKKHARIRIRVIRPDRERLLRKAGQAKIESLVIPIAVTPAKRFEYDDYCHSFAGTSGGRAGRPAGHRRRGCAGASNGLPAAHGSAHCARHFAFCSIATHRSGGVAGILEAGPSGLEGWYFVRVGDAAWRLRG